MRFKSLPQSSQQSLATRWVEFVKNETPAGVFPTAPAATWLAAFRQLNVKLLFNGLPSMETMDKVTEWVTNQIVTGQSVGRTGLTAFGSF